MKQKILLLLFLLLPIRLWASLYIVGSATQFMWNRLEMTELSSGIYQWQGYLTYGGELKFMTEQSDWGAHWGPSSAYANLPYGISKIALHTSGDFKYRVIIEGDVILTVDTNQKQITVSHEDGSLPSEPMYPRYLYPMGTAVLTGSDYSFLQQGSDSGVYHGRLSLQEGALSFHAQPYCKITGERMIQERLSSQQSYGNKKLFYNISTDRCSYLPGQQITFTLSATPIAGMRVRYRHLADIVADTLLTTKTWKWTAPARDFCGYMVEVYTTDGTSDIVYGTIGVDVSSDWVRFPRYGFVATYSGSKIISAVRNEMMWLNRCHINAVQFQDWHNSHDWPLGGTREKLLSTYKDIANRTIYTSAIKNYITYQHQYGMKCFFYNLCYGVLDGYESRGVKDEWLVYKDQEHTQKDKHDLPENWKSDIYLANPGNPDWQSFLSDRNDDVYACLDFDGYQIDQLGPRGTLYDYEGNKINLTDGYASFIQAMKVRHPHKRLIMNAVSEYGASNMASTGKLDCFYNEVWGCHSSDALTNTQARFSNLKNIIQNNRTNNAALQTVFAAYMNYCCDNSNFNVPGVVMTDAVMFALGGSHLELGGDHMLCREYFPHAGQNMTAQLEDWTTRYYDFLTAYENLLRGDWTENATVKVTANGVTVNRWEPVNQQITQIARNVEGRRVIHLLNFCTQESTQITDPDYLLCWHDKNGIRPWPVEHKDLPLTISGLSGMGKIRRLWVASPDYLGGAVQEITDYTLTSTTLRFKLPALQFWSMIVLEPESTTTADNMFYGPSQVDAEADIFGPNSLQKVMSESQSWHFPFEGAFDATIDLSAGILTFSGDGVDGIIEVPLAPGTPKWGFTLFGTPATTQTRGIIVRKGCKTIRR